MIKAVIFDMDGVIVDTEPVYFERVVEFLEHHQKPVNTKELTQLVGSTDTDVWNWVQKLWGENLERKEYDEAFRAFYKERPIPYRDILDQDIFEVLDWLKQEEYKIGLASSSSLRTIEHVLKLCELTHYFDSILSGEMFHQSKPNPEIYVKSAEKLDVHPQECVAIEDSTFGIKAGKAAGMVVLAKEDDRFNFQQELADKKIKSLKAIIDELKA